MYSFKGECNLLCLWDEFRLVFLITTYFNKSCWWKKKQLLSKKRVFKKLRFFSEKESKTKTIIFISFLFSPYYMSFESLKKQNLSPIAEAKTLYSYGYRRKGFATLKRAAKNGNVMACYDCGFMMIQGIECKKDLKGGLELISKGKKLEEESGDMNWKSNGSITEVFEPQTMYLNCLFLFMNLVLNDHISSWIHTLRGDLTPFFSLISLYDTVFIVTELFRVVCCSKWHWHLIWTELFFVIWLKWTTSVFLLISFFFSTLLFIMMGLWERWNVAYWFKKDVIFGKQLVKLENQEQHHYQKYWELIHHSLNCS